MSRFPATLTVVSHDPLADIERALVRIRRRQTGRALGRAAAASAAPSGRPLDLAAAAVVDALDGPAASGEERTVGFVADRLAVDPSRASRQVAAAVAAGYVRRAASPADGRRSVLEVTAEGQDLLAAARAARRDLVRRATARWSAADRRTFAALLTRFTDGLDAR
jgi:DNA-binding MarR family transcriptional regulator